MKVYISADIEGITGTTHWDEATQSKPDFREFQEQMTAEVAAACEGALRAGATEIMVKDAHASARNIIAAKLPREARLVRGWSGHPFSMVQYLDETFHALLMVGFHSSAGADTNPLAHTISGRVARCKINDRYASDQEDTTASAPCHTVGMLTEALNDGGAEVVTTVLAPGLHRRGKSWHQPFSTGN
jgi:D-amino peptidase